MFPGAHAQHFPERPAVIVAETGKTISYRQLDHDSAALARVLHDAGLRSGDVVALLSDNAPEALVVLWATQRSGLYVTAVNHHLTASEAAYIVGDSGARALIASATLAELATAVVAEGGGPDLRMAFGGQIDGFDEYGAAIAGAGPALPTQRAVQ